MKGIDILILRDLANDAGVTMDRNKTDDIVDVTNLPNNSYKYTFPFQTVKFKEIEVSFKMMVYAK